MKKLEFQNIVKECLQEILSSFILVGSIDANDLHIAARKFDKNHPHTNHSSIAKTMVYPKNWRMRSDDKIVMWWDTPTEEEKESVHSWIADKTKLIPLKHKNLADISTSVAASKAVNKRHTL